jgi:dihydrofolate synthase/folylpolyglutamate synthase
MNYQSALNFLDSLQSTRIELGLSRIEAACRSLHDPQKKYPTVHVAGTNGKGSTCAFLESIFRHTGMKVGLYTSPHLVDVRERIQINREPMSEEDFSELVFCHCESAKGGRSNLPQLTYFEFLAAMAFRYFLEKKVDIAVIEVGLGGRLDATNVITPLVSVITRIGMDHQGYLGDTLEAIAHEKCGIIKNGVPVVTVDQEPSAMAVIREAAEEKGCMLHVVSSTEVKYKLGLLGRHQYENAALALRASELVSDVIASPSRTDEAISRAFLNTRWPGRLEVVSREPLIILDGAHNALGAESLARFVRGEFKNKKVTIILGIMADKDVEDIVGRLAPLADRLILTRPNIQRAADPNEISARAGLVSGSYEVITPLKTAIVTVREQMPPDGVLIITGSLYTVGEAMQTFSS